MEGGIVRKVNSGSYPVFLCSCTIQSSFSVLLKNHYIHPVLHTFFKLFPFVCTNYNRPHCSRKYLTLSAPTYGKKPVSLWPFLHLKMIMAVYFGQVRRQRGSSSRLHDSVSPEEFQR
uniref:Uncharacterized protein n=1 Tax=Sphaerodactylus townsendi TaxID=933632 RepID=A0ACB8EIL8_9SAUR